MGTDGPLRHTDPNGSLSGMTVTLFSDSVSDLAVRILINHLLVNGMSSSQQEKIEA